MNAVSQSFSVPVSPAPHVGDLCPESIEPVFDVARESVSLLASRHSVTLEGKALDIPKFMLLGQRGGGKPIRLAIFGGLDAGLPDTSAAISRLFLQLELNPALAKDYALFGYPLVNLQGFTEAREPLRKFEARYASDEIHGDVGFFKAELRKWFFDGLVVLRTDLQATAFHATVRSEVIAREVVEPTLRSLSASLPVTERPVRLRHEDRQARLADYAHGRLAPPADIRPYPFEIELSAPGSLSSEERIRGLFLTLHEVLRNYRKLISHAQNL
ncbi:MAG TPA: hypothetical protein VF614_07055 [Chthoniobacteraceae bacterium]|jgi:hypothetical protein